MNRTPAFLPSPAASRRGRTPLATLAAATALLLAAALPAVAADAAAGKNKAQMCASCHGANGLSSTPDAPNLAGQPEIYLVSALRAYKSGARKHEVMSVMAQTLSDADIADVAAWYSAIKVEAKPPN